MICYGLVDWLIRYPMTAIITVVFTSCPTRGGQQRNQFIYAVAIRGENQSKYRKDPERRKKSRKDAKRRKKTRKDTKRRQKDPENQQKDPLKFSLLWFRYQEIVDKFISGNSRKKAYLILFLT